jgi:tetratricopeptide (TPR) repeat protein
MASKVSRHAAKSPADGMSSALRAEVERLIEKERYKDAVKQAKLCFKEAGTPENHGLLERTYFLRARQLLQQGMRSSAVEVAQHLLEFGVTGSDSLEELVRLLITLGFEKSALQIQERLGSPAQKERVTELAADQLVLHPERNGVASPELVRDAGLIREALSKLQAKDETGAMETLRDLARSSPLSEWKFFVRGLAAFYRHDEAESRANWDRLARQRMAFLIVEKLRRLTAEAAGSNPTSLETMEKLIFGEPILSRLRQVRDLAASQEWDKVFRLLGPLRHSLQQIDPKLGERLTVVLIGSLIKAAQDLDWPEANRLITQFTRVAQPMELDPRWNRLWAIIWDGPHADAEGATQYWVDYIGDLETVASLTPSERVLAQAIVWNHVAQLHAEDVEYLLDELDEPDFPPFARRRRGAKSKGKLTNQPEVVAARKQVLDSLERSLKLAPEHLPTYRLLVEVHQDWDDAKGLEAAARRLLSTFPDDIETLQLLGRHYFEKSDLAAALPPLQKARRLKPLDESLRELEWMIRVGLARNCALSGRWDEGRAEFAAADELLPESRQQYTYLVRKAVFEYKAGQGERSDEYVKQAQDLLVEPAPLWLALAIESIRYHMPKSTVDGYTKNWETEQKKKCRSETAGALAEQMGAFLAAGIDYSGRGKHLTQVLTYLRRTLRLKYRREDIEPVVELLKHVPDEFPLLEKLVKAGLKQHPDSALLNLHAGEVELIKGKIIGGTQTAQKYLETALKLAEASTDPKVTALLPAIRTQLGMLGELSERFGRFGFPFGGGPSFFENLDFDDDFDDDDFDDDDFDDEDRIPVPIPTRRAPKKRGSRKSKKKR